MVFAIGLNRSSHNVVSPQVMRDIRGFLPASKDLDHFEGLTPEETADLAEATARHQSCIRRFEEGAWQICEEVSWQILKMARGKK